MFISLTGINNDMYITYGRKRSSIFIYREKEEVFGPIGCKLDGNMSSKKGMVIFQGVWCGLNTIGVTYFDKQAFQ